MLADRCLMGCDYLWVRVRGHGVIFVSYTVTHNRLLQIAVGFIRAFVQGEGSHMDLVNLRCRSIPGSFLRLVVCHHGSCILVSSSALVHVQGNYPIRTLGMVGVFGWQKKRSAVERTLAAVSLPVKPAPERPGTHNIRQVGMYLWLPCSIDVVAATGTPVQL